jgi:hypothetical protein
LNFSPIPLSAGNYPSIVITSSNDPYISGGKSAVSGGTMGSAFINIGPKVHLNSDLPPVLRKDKAFTILIIIEADKSLINRVKQSFE